MSTYPLERFNEEELIHYAKSLLEQSQGRLEVGDAKGAAWRLADALGALSLVVEEETQGIHTFTGMGYRLQGFHDNPKQVEPTE